MSEINADWDDCRKKLSEARAQADYWRQEAEQWHEAALYKHSVIRTEAIEECAKAMEEMYSIKDHIAALTLRALKDRP